MLRTFKAYSGVGINNEDKIFSRLWLTSRDPDEASGPQQIGFINFIPQCVDEGGYFSGPKFEQFGDALNRMNETLRRQPIQGKNDQINNLQNVQNRSRQRHKLCIKT